MSAAAAAAAALAARRRDIQSGLQPRFALITNTHLACHVSPGMPGLRALLGGVEVVPFAAVAAATLAGQWALSRKLRERGWTLQTPREPPL